MSDLFDGSNAPPEDADPSARIEVADRFLDGATLTRLSLKDAVLADSLMPGARVEDVDAEGAAFVNVNLRRATLRDVTLEGATLEAVDLSGVTVTGATLDGMTIDGVLVTDLIAAWRAR